MRQRRVFLLLAVVTILLVGVSGYFVYQNIQLGENDNTFNWKTYTDEKNGFSFKYPSNWKVVTTSKDKIYAVNSLGYIAPQDFELKEDVANTPGPPISFHYYSNPKKLSLDEYNKDEMWTISPGLSPLTPPLDGEIIEEKSNLIPGIPVYHRLNSSCAPLSCDKYIFSREDKVYEFTSMDLNYLEDRPIDEQQRNIFDLILSTFRFTEN